MSALRIIDVVSDFFRGDWIFYFKLSGKIEDIRRFFRLYDNFVFFHPNHCPAMFGKSDLLTDCHGNMYLKFGRNSGKHLIFAGEKEI